MIIMPSITMFAIDGTKRNRSRICEIHNGRTSTEKRALTRRAFATMLESLSIPMAVNLVSTGGLA